jgi:hypothetical protein
MGWFGGGSDDSSKSSSAETSFKSSDSDGFGSGGTNFAASGGGGAAGAGQLQQFSLGLQQQMLIQAVVTNLNDVAFNRCLTGKPSDSLSGKEVACVHATVGKWLDSNEFVMGRMQKKQQVAQQSLS